MQPDITPLLEAARARGLGIQPGKRMLDGQLDAICDFLTGGGQV
jgi:shikimate dehydrogenase